MDEAERALVESAKTGGRTLLWLYAPGYAGEDATSLEKMSALTGFTLRRSVAAMRPEVMISATAHPLTQGLEGRTFGPAVPLNPMFYVSAGGDDPAQPLGNLLANPGFEDGTTNWVQWELSPKVAVTGVNDASQAHAGARCVRVDFTPEASIVSLIQELADPAALGVSDGTLLRLSAWHRSSLPRPASKIRLAKVYINNSGGVSVPTWITSPGIAGNRDTWTSQTLEFQHQVDPQMPGLRVLLNADDAAPGPGTVWWDDARLEVADNAASPLIRQTQWELSPRPMAVAPATTATLGVYTQTGQPGLQLQDHGSWKSIFCGSPSLSTPLVRAIARYAGVNLLIDGDDLDAQDVAQFNGRYLYVYARGRSGRRCFQLAGEKVPNGGFEKFTGSLPESGFGRWISPFYGSLAACTVAAGEGQGGGNGLRTGAFSSGAGQYSIPVGIRLMAEEGKTYKVSCAVRISGLNADAAGAGDYVYLNFQPAQWTAAAATCKIAEGSKTYVTDGVWTQFTASYTHLATSASQPEMALILRVNGPYSAENIILDNVSVREAGSLPAMVTEVMSGRTLGAGVTGWVDDLALNEQKIYRLDGEDSSAAREWTLY